MDGVRISKTIENAVALVYYISDHFLFLHKVGILRLADDSKAAFLVYILRHFVWAVENLMLGVINAIKIHKGNVQLQKMVTFT